MFFIYVFDDFFCIFIFGVCGSVKIHSKEGEGNMAYHCKKEKHVNHRLKIFKPSYCICKNNERRNTAEKIDWKGSDCEYVNHLVRNFFTKAGVYKKGCDEGE